MRSGKFARLLLLVAALSFFPSKARTTDNSLSEVPVDIQPGVAQLFIDDYLIASQRNLRRTLHQPEKDHGGERPILYIQDEFGDYNSSLYASGSIVYDPRLEKYVMFARAVSFHREEGAVDRRWDSRRWYRYTSKDGLSWIKGDDGSPQLIFPKSRAILADNPHDEPAAPVGLFTCYYDTDNAAYPYQGWAWFPNCGNACEGIYHMRSADGLDWQRGRQIIDGYAGGDDPTYREIHQAGRTMRGPGDTTRFAYDPIEDRILGIFKFFSAQPVEHGNRLRARAYAFLDRLDRPFDTGRIERIALLPPAAETNGDHPYDEYYSSTAWRYESLWLGELKVWHSQGDYPFSDAGAAYAKLISSRDGLHWRKVQYPKDDGIPEVFIPNGPEGGNNGRNDGGYMTFFSTGPLRIGDELIFYYGSSSYGKNHPREIFVSGGGIFRARLRDDGFVSVDGGTITTHPLCCPTGTLTLNAVGPLSVELLSAGGDPLARTEIRGDSLRHPVRFYGRPHAYVAGGNPFRLRFTVQPPGRLYSFTFGRVHHHPLVRLLKSVFDWFEQQFEWIEQQFERVNTQFSKASARHSFESYA